MLIASNAVREAQHATVSAAPPERDPMKHEFSNDQSKLISSGAPSLIESTLQVTGLSNRIFDVNVQLNVTHTRIEDLRITLIASSGDSVLLVAGEGSSGDHLKDTVFDDSGTKSIQGNAAPFEGIFKPEENLSKLNEQNQNGTWKLRIEDQAFQDGGSLRQLGLGNVGIFRVFGLKPAVADLEAIFPEIQSEQRDVLDIPGYSGMLCTRLVRDSNSLISNHAWGTAVDLHLEGGLDIVGDNQVQPGLALIAPILNRHGWYWGAGFGREDAMHFEVSDGRMRQWHAEGLLTGRAPHVGDDMLSQSDRCPEVVALQKRLQELGFTLEADGIFGPITRAALVSFQTDRALRPTSLLDADTAAALKESEETDAVRRLGSKGQAVGQWQEFLRQQKFTQVVPSTATSDPRRELLSSRTGWCRMASLAPRHAPKPRPWSCQSGAARRANRGPAPDEGQRADPGHHSASTAAVQKRQRADRHTDRFHQWRQAPGRCSRVALRRTARQAQGLSVFVPLG